MSEDPVDMYIGPTDIPGVLFVEPQDLSTVEIPELTEDKRSDRWRLSMVKLGPIREEARQMLVIAMHICDAFCESSAYSCANYALSSIHGAESGKFDTTEEADTLLRWSNRLDLSDWSRNVTRLCSDILRWTHEEERMRESHVLQLVCPSLTVKVDTDTRELLATEWIGIAETLEPLLGYEVNANNGIMLRHGRLTFDPLRLIFLFHWTEKIVTE